MKIIRYKSGSGTHYGVLEDDGSILELSGSIFDQFKVGLKVDQLKNVQILAPVDPRKVICTGLNYQSHIREMELATPEFPMLFMKPHTTVTNPEEPIMYPRAGQKVEYEGELTIVIGKPTKQVSEAEALDHVLGYTCANDVSERVFQLREMKNGAMLIGKSFDTFCPLGPVISTGLDPTNLELTTRLNGEIKQHINTSDLLFTASHLISYISEAIHLLPGDVILTGTPSGVAPMKPGDLVEIEISGIGTLRNPVVKDT